MKSRDFEVKYIHGTPFNYCYRIITVYGKGYLLPKNNKTPKTLQRYSFAVVKRKDKWSIICVENGFMLLESYNCKMVDLIEVFWKNLQKKKRNGKLKGLKATWELVKEMEKYNNWKNLTNYIRSHSDLPLSFVTRIPGRQRTNIEEKEAQKLFKKAEEKLGITNNKSQITNSCYKSSQY